MLTILLGLFSGFCGVIATLLCEYWNKKPAFFIEIKFFDKIDARQWNSVLTIKNVGQRVASILEVTGSIEDILNCRHNSLFDGREEITPIKLCASIEPNSSISLKIHAPSSMLEDTNDMERVICLKIKFKDNFFLRKFCRCNEKKFEFKLDRFLNDNIGNAVIFDLKKIEKR